MPQTICFSYEYVDDDNGIIYDIPNHAITSCTDAECLDGDFGILANFTNFLRGAGFAIDPHDTLMLVRDNQMVVDQETAEGT